MIKRLPLLVSLALLPLAQLSAKSKAQADFSEFKGNYNGTTLLTINSGTIVTATGPISIQVAVPRNGRTAVATFSGSVTSGPNTVPLSGTFTMTKSTLSCSDAIFNLFSTAGPFTVPGKPSRNGFKASGSTTVASTPVLIQSTAKVKPRGKKKKKISITYVLSASGTSFTFQFTAIGKVRKN